MMIKFEFFGVFIFFSAKKDKTDVIYNKKYIFVFAMMQ